MNSVAVDTANNLQQNLQAIQYNYQNNNLTFYREYQASSGGGQEPRTIAHNNNNYQQQQQPHWVDNSNPNSISLTDQHRIDCYHKGIEVRSTLPTATNENPSKAVNDLIVAFNSSFDISEANQHQLPQIILSDFSSDQPTPPTTPLFSTVQTSARTLSEHPPQLQEFQLYRSNTTI
ncbi:uncharacterized protein LOC129570877 [Sitodiplosis mosellana]|uniref:uncharacterized protein LOC129570877 n=1 Tax=Sitodiplosis mosellana TaxID=263140 RepID=UPI0024442B2F|nr:uncharacterized protein LOC129570877 [Sitodiplosis mosellana]